MRTIDHEQYWAAVDEAEAPVREAIYTAFAEAEEGFGSVEDFEQFSREVLGPASVLVARINGCHSDTLIEFYWEIIELHKQIAAGDAERLSMTSEAEQAFYRRRVEELEKSWRGQQRCHPESGYFVCYCR